MNDFLKQWGEAAYTTTGFFWMALWAFVLGYIISSMIQIFVTEKRMQKTMGGEESKGVLLGTFFGFISSSCSFAALASTKSLFKKGASFISSIAFLLASTNLVIELGIIISIFLGWQFVVGEYAGGILLIGISWILIKLINPKKLIDKARKNLEKEDEGSGMDDSKNWKKQIQKEDSWAKVGKKYKMEWQMVWKDVTVGFTIAGIVAAFVPDAWFQTLFIGSGQGNTDFSFFEILEHIIVGPAAAFVTFIGSMGNIPLAALLFGKGVSFAGVMAFIFSDLVVFPILRINAKYYGWKMSLFILFLLFTALIGASLILHYSFDLMSLLPDPSQVKVQNSEYFKINYTFYLNLAFLAISGYLIYLGFFKKKDVDSKMGEMAPKSQLLENILKYAAFISYIWIAGGLIVKFFMN
ncbi:MULTISPECIES: permease [Mesonia]|uniref:Permease n=1 Tax=Mesonia oceanica TaxID=2687242 RepID=A0AC61Y4D7_9FLAO|nr:MULTISPECIES: permease [Mesonia]MAN29521.1 permease [Mesonia sp.]MAQ41657.1 permease [Mesonia sp.]MBJ98712.1 permease [Flavobacteriaceae bacterium]VVU99358.1 Putative permease [Mesonia oceanica]|tara:strand:- start:15000 stop:16229 length:1230 start_codon:yes stop_codon:yes gene_type:complete